MKNNASDYPVQYMQIMVASMDPRHLSHVNVDGISDTFVPFMGVTHRSGSGTPNVLNGSRECVPFIHIPYGNFGYGVLSLSSVALKL